MRKIYPFNNRLVIFALLAMIFTFSGCKPENNYRQTSEEIQKTNNSNYSSSISKNIEASNIHELEIATTVPEIATSSSKIARDIPNPGIAEKKLESADKENIIEDMPDEEPEEIINSNQRDISSWQIYENEDLGVKFKYPDEYDIQEGNELKDFDIGKKKDISVAPKKEEAGTIFSIRAFSENFGIGIGEGCCFYYTDKPIDVNLPIDRIKDKLKDFRPFEIKKIKLNGKVGIKFYSIKEYVGFWVIETYLFPINNSIYANLMVESPILFHTESICNIQELCVGNYEAVAEIFLKKTEDMIKNKEFDRYDDGIMHKYNKFLDILATIELK